MAGALELDVAELGPDDPFLQDRAERPHAEGGRRRRWSTARSWPIPRSASKLVEGGEAAVAASTDPMIVLARKLDPLRREMIKWMEDNVQSVEQRAGEQLGKARFAAYGKTTYPGCHFHAAAVLWPGEGLSDERHGGAYKTTFYGLYDRASSFDFAVRSICLRATRKAATSWICRRRSIS